MEDLYGNVERRGGGVLNQREIQSETGESRRGGAKEIESDGVRQSVRQTHGQTQKMARERKREKERERKREKDRERKTERERERE